MGTYDFSSIKKKKRNVLISNKLGVYQQFTHELRRLGPSSQLFIQLTNEGVTR